MEIVINTEMYEAISQQDRFEEGLPGVKVTPSDDVSLDSFILLDATGRAVKCGCLALPADVSRAKVAVASLTRDIRDSWGRLALMASKARRDAPSWGGMLMNPEEQAHIEAWLAKQEKEGNP